MFNLLVEINCAARLCLKSVHRTVVEAMAQVSLTENNFCLLRTCDGNFDDATVEQIFGGKVFRARMKFALMCSSSTQH